jgi:hypothetical protein
MKNKQGVVHLGFYKTKSNQTSCKFGKLGPGCLLEAIDGFLKFADMTRKLAVNKA